MANNTRSFGRFGSNQVDCKFLCEPEKNARKKDVVPKIEKIDVIIKIIYILLPSI